MSKPNPNQPRLVRTIGPLRIWRIRNRFMVRQGRSASMSIYRVYGDYATLREAKEIRKDPNAEKFYSNIAWQVRKTTKRNLDFAASVKFKEGKRQWYSAELNKLSNKEDAQYDSRYHRVEPRHNGQALSMAEILQVPHQDFLQRLAIFDDIRDYCYDNDIYASQWEEFNQALPGRDDQDKTGDWRAAFTSLREAIHGAEMLQNSARTAEICVSNTKLFTERAQQAVTAEAAAA